MKKQKKKKKKKKKKAKLPARTINQRKKPVPTFTLDFIIFSGLCYLSALFPFSTFVLTYSTKRVSEGGIKVI